MKYLIRNIKYNRIPTDILRLVELLDDTKNHTVVRDQIHIYGGPFILFQIKDNTIYVDHYIIGQYLSNYSFFNNNYEAIKYINEAIRISNYSTYKKIIL